MATEVDSDVIKDPAYQQDSDEGHEFRSLSRAAIVSVVFAVLGSTAFLHAAMTALLLLGIAAGVIGYVNTRLHPDEITGRKLALGGLLACLLLFSAATSMHLYVYVNEVPKDYQRVIWAELQPEKKRQASPVPASALELDGAKIFMKGYILQPKGGRKTDLKSFILVRDIGSCCFGGTPKPTHIVKVELPEGKTTDWNMRLRRLTGVFHVDSELQPAGEVRGFYYRLEADDLK